MWSLVGPVAAFPLAALALVTAYLAIRTAHTPQGAAGWTVFILSLPMVAIPIYLLLGYINYASVSTGSRRDGARMRPVPAPVPEGRLAVFTRMGGNPAVGGNTAALLIDGEDTYAGLIQAIEGATDHILMQFYIIRDDEVGRRFADALAERARAGVMVCLMHEAFRGVGLPRRMTRKLTEAGVRVAAPRRSGRLIAQLQFNYRNHRKVVIVDNRTAFTGGLNVGREYLGRDRRYGPWRDTFIRLTGPIVAQFDEVYASEWQAATGMPLPPRAPGAAAVAADGLTALVLSPAPNDPTATGNLLFCALAQMARRRLWIATPYFVPDLDVLSALKLAALRGVDVRILVPDRPDHLLPWLAAFAFFDDIRDTGGEIWRYTAGFMHQKVTLVDDDLASVGTVNLDIRSGLLNFEQTVIVEDRGFAADVAEMLERDFARAYVLRTGFADMPLRRRVAARFARLLAPLL